jgi:hypothetical protein
MPKRSATFVELKFRVRAPLHARLTAEARRGKTSLAAEVTRRLEKSFEVAEVNDLIAATKAGLETLFEQMEKRAKPLAALPHDERVAFDAQALRVLLQQADALVQMEGRPLAPPEVVEVVRPGGAKRAR